MAKKKHGKRPPSGKPPVEKDENFDNVNQGDEDFYLDEIDKFHANKEKILLEDEGSDDDGSMQSEEEEVLAIDSDDDSEDEVNESDDEDGNKGITSGSAWGKRKSLFYGADTLDGLEGSDREEAEKAEEKEVLAIQKRLAEQIDDDDFGLDILKVADGMTDETVKEGLKYHVVADFSTLSKKAQWKLVKKESPELDGLIHDFKAKLTELETEVSPLMKLVKNGTIPKGFGSDFISLKHRVYFAYLLNISFYLALKANKTQVQNHPIISRLVQYRTVINQLSPIETKLRPEIDDILQENANVDLGSNSEAEEPTLFANESAFSEDSDNSEEIREVKHKKKLKRKSEEEENADENIAQEFSKSLSEKLQEETIESDGETVAKGDDEARDRRAINTEIAKNKGLRQKRRKIDRNPRVKMRQKYRKAKIRRKGQVREYKPEIKKYSGEASGIRIGVKKSITLQ